jgi:hypothetical protein
MLTHAASIRSSSTLALGAFLLAPLVHAMDPSAPAPAAPAHLSTPIAPALDGPYEPAPGCVLTDSSGLPASDARAASEIVCTQIAKHIKQTATYRIRFGTLGSKLVLTVYQDGGGRSSQQQVILSGADEIPAGAERVAAAFAGNTATEDTATSTTVLASETTAKKSVAGSMAFEGGINSFTTLGSAVAPCSGLYTALRYDAKRYSVGASARFWGLSKDAGYQGLSLDVGGRFHFAEGNVVPFAGGGMGLARFALGDGRFSSTGSGSGAILFAEGGVHLLKLNRVSWSIALRVDLPTFASNTNWDGGQQYVAAMGLTTGLAFR